MTRRHYTDAMRWLVGLAAVAAGLTACEAPVLVATPTTQPTQAEAYPVAEVPWAGLGLSGSLVVAQFDAGVWALDLTTGDIATIYTPTDSGQEWVNAAAVAPNGRDVVVALAPRPEPGNVQFGYTELWLTTVAGEPLRPLLQRQSPQESLFAPDWSEDGRAVIYSRLVRSISTEGALPVYGYQIEQLDVATGATVVRVPDGYWPRLTGDALAFVGVSPDATRDTGLYYQPDRTAPATHLSGGDAFAVVDAPLLLSTGDAAPNQMLFSAPATAAGAHRGPARMLPALVPPVRPEAHNVPSTWWTIALDKPDRAQPVTDLGLTGLFAAQSIDGQWVAFISTTGLYVMRPDGKQLTLLLPLHSTGTVDWIASRVAAGK